MTAVEFKNISPEKIKTVALDGVSFDADVIDGSIKTLKLTDRTGKTLCLTAQWDAVKVAAPKPVTKYVATIAGEAIAGQQYNTEEEATNAAQAFCDKFGISSVSAGAEKVEV